MYESLTGTKPNEIWLGTLNQVNYNENLQDKMWFDNLPKGTHILVSFGSLPTTLIGDVIIKLISSLS